MNSIRKAMSIVGCVVVAMNIGCKKETEAHHGAWLSNQKEMVTFCQSDSTGATICTTEVYNDNPLLDGMKLEFALQCSPQANATLKPNGRYDIICTDARLTRSTKGIAMFMNMEKILSGFDDTSKSKKDDVSSVTFEAKKEHGKLMIFSKNKEGKEENYTFEPVPQRKVESFLTKFRAGTVEIKATGDKRKRNLP